MKERGHGLANRLLLEGVDTDALDAILDSGGEGAAGARFALTNTFTGPNRFGRMFPRARRFRPVSENLVALAESMVQERLTVHSGHRRHQADTGRVHLLRPVR
jgi:hypothetical protein